MQKLQGREPLMYNFSEDFPTGQFYGLNKRKTEASEHASE